MAALRVGAAPRAATPCAFAARSRRPRSAQPLVCRAVTGAASHADAARLAALLAATGAETSLVVGDGPLGRGVFTTHAVKESDLLLRVPLQHVLCVTTAGSRDTVEQQLKALRAAVPPEAGGAAGKGGVPRVMEDYLTNRKQSAPARLAAWLLWAMRLSPVWRLAGELLPDPDFRVAVATRDAPELHAAYAKAVSSDPSLAVTEAQFAWALSCVASRTFGADAWTRGDRDGVLGLMVPLADLLNHRFNPNCEFRLRKEAGVFEVFARIGIKAGEEACISYGEDLTNQELSDRYGFTLVNNPNGEVPKPFRDKYTDRFYSAPSASAT